MDPARVRETARAATTEYLLDRVTVGRGEVEPDAVAIFEAELTARGVTRAEIEAHAADRERGGLVRHPDGTVVRCSFCSRPAVERRWKWHRLWGWFLPLFPRVI